MIKTRSLNHIDDPFSFFFGGPIIGPQDLRNPAAPRVVYGPDNWLRSHDDFDDPGD